MTNTKWRLGADWARAVEQWKATKPKKAPSSWINFLTAKRPEMSAKHPDVGFGGITTLVAAEWAKLSDEEKAAYKSAPNT